MKSGVAPLLLFAILVFQVGSKEPSAKNSASASIGTETGQRAPAFALPDQFDRLQSNETLRGSNGTVLLFFRSADW